MSVAIVIVAAGRGRRMGEDLPKQYLTLGSKPVLRWTIEAFLQLEEVSRVLTVIHPDDQTLCAQATEGLSDPRLADPVAGAETRAKSVLNGLEALTGSAPDKVLIHDAARPFVPAAVIEAVIRALDTHPGACAALPLVDALWQSEDGLATRSVPREGLWRAQTPQGFHFPTILAAHRAHDGQGADDVAVAHEAGIGVHLVLGSERAFKITTKDDLARARAGVGA